MKNNKKKTAQVLESERLGSESHIYHPSVSQHWVSHLIFLNLSAPVCTMGIAICKCS